MRGFILLLLLNISVLYGQYEDNLTYGLKLGVLRSGISNLPEMLIGREHNLFSYEISSKSVYGLEGSFFLNYKFPDTRVGIQPEFMYRKSGGEVHYSNSSNNEEYSLRFNYSYLVFGAMYKLYPLGGFNIGVGGYYSKNLRPNSLDYSSTIQGGLYDTNYRQFYRDGIVGKDDFSIGFSLGYELRDSFHFDLRYYLGLGDVLSNRSTSFQFLENNNRSSHISLSIGYSFHQW